MSIFSLLLIGAEFFALLILIIDTGMATGFPNSSRAAVGVLQLIALFNDHYLVFLFCGLLIFIAVVESSVVLLAVLNKIQTLSTMALSQFLLKFF